MYKPRFERRYLGQKPSNDNHLVPADRMIVEKRLDFYSRILNLVSERADRCRIRAVLGIVPKC